MQAKGVSYIIQKSGSQIARRSRLNKDGILEVYVSRRYAACFLLIVAELERGNRPSYGDLTATLRWKTLSGVHYAVKTFIEYGLLRATSAARSLDVTPEGAKVAAIWRDKIKRKVGVIGS